MGRIDSAPPLTVHITPVAANATPTSSLAPLPPLEQPTAPFQISATPTQGLAQPKAPARVAQTPAQIPADLNAFAVAPIGPSRWLLSGGYLGEWKPGTTGTRSALFMQLKTDGTLRVLSLAKPMHVSRWGHAMETLKNGAVFIAGGGGSNLDTEIYLPKTGEFVPGPKLVHPRGAVVQTLLADGRVLIAGGYNDDPKGHPELGKTLRSAEVYDPETKTISRVGDMAVPRAGHALVTVAGKTYAIGGSSKEAAEIEVFEQGEFKKTGLVLPHALKDFRTHVIGDDVYIIGGTSPDPDKRSHGEIYRLHLTAQPLSFEPLPITITPREDFAIIPTSTPTRVIVLGGERKIPDSEDAPVGEVELLDLGKEPSRTTASLEMFRDDLRTLVLPNGGGLVLGGTDQHHRVQTTVLNVR